MEAAKATDWKTAALPAKMSITLLDRVFSSEDMKRIRIGLVPEVMEDKWFIYWEDNTLFFHRSWTGFCIYIVRFSPQGDNFRMVQADVNRDPEQHTETDDARDAAMISYLIDVLLLRQESTFPSEESSHTKKAVMQWSQIGRAMLGEHPERKGGRVDR